MINFFKSIYNKVDSYFSSNENITINELSSRIKDLELKNLHAKRFSDEVIKQNSALIIEIEDYQEEIEALKLELKKTQESELDYWDNKLPHKTSYYYPARNGNNTDVIRFLNSNNEDVPIVTGIDLDAIANNTLRWIKNNIKYTSDLKTSNRIEHWQWANETLTSKKGDCEDGAILMANMMIASGIPYKRIRLNAGDVQYPINAKTKTGHAYVSYLKEEDNTWYVMDWCYWYSESVNFKKTWKVAEKYFGIWFSWNKERVFIKDKLDRD